VSATAYQPAVPPPPAPTAGRGLVVAGIVTAAAGVLLAILSIALLVSGAISAGLDQLTAPLLSYPGTTSLSLNSTGTYLVFESSGDPVVLQASDLSVAGPDGSPLQISSPSIDEQINRNGETFFAVAEFQAAAPGNYAVTVTSSADAQGTMVVARGAGTAVVDRAWWGLGIAGGVLLVIVGVVLLAVGLTRRRRDRQLAAGYQAAGSGTYASTYGAGGPTQAYPQQYAPQYSPQYPAQYPPQYPAQGPPAGWYPDPDPSRPDGQRYWDGATWTGYTA
jgi:hypothetical protein